MPWWVWLAAGAALLALEMALIDAGFYLVFLGLAAAGVGLLGLAGFGSALWEQLIAFAGLAALLMVGLRRRLYRLMRGERAAPGLAGELLVVRESIEPGATGRADLCGASWTVRNVGGQALPAGGRARVLGVHGVTLEVRSE